MVRAVVEGNNSGATVGAYHFDISKPVGLITIVSVYSDLTENQIINFSFAPVIPQTHYLGINERMINSVGAAIINAAGNTGNEVSAGDVDNTLVTNSSDVIAAYQVLGETGLVLWVVGLDWQVTNKLAGRSNKCGVLMTFCLAAPFRVPYQAGARDTGYRSGTSYSAPLVAGALDMLLTRWPQLNNRSAISILLESADKEGVLDGWDATLNVSIHELYGHGALNLANAYKPMGPLTLSMQGNSMAVAVGELALPGLGADVSLNAFDRYRRDYPVIERNLAVAPVRPLAAPDFVAFAHSPRWQASFDPAANHPALMRSFASGASGVYVAPNEAGLAWPRLGAALAIARDTEFFGGHGTGSLEFGTSRYLGLRARREIDLGHGRLTAGLQVAHGRAADGPLVRRLGGTMLQPRLAWTRTLGARTTLELDAQAVLFRGGFELAGAEHRLAHGNFGVGARIRLDF